MVYRRDLRTRLANPWTINRLILSERRLAARSAQRGALSTTNSRTPTDTRDWRQERGRSDFDRRHVLAANSLWELPVGRQKRFGSSIHPALNHIVGGWSLNGIYTFMSGEPFSVRSGVRTSNFSHESRADIVGAKPPIRSQEAPGVIGPVVLKDASASASPVPGTNVAV